MSAGETYVMKGHGAIEPACMRRCMSLFRERGVNIRKLLLLKDRDPERYAMLEIHFVLPADNPPARGDFLDTLEMCMASQSWSDRSLEKI